MEAQAENILRGLHTQTKHHSMYVAGEWTGSEARMEATSPATGEVSGPSRRGREKTCIGR